jgi:methylmalonyl-CoA mutase cobalamin-binding subunit
MHAAATRRILTLVALVGALSGAEKNDWTLEYAPLGQTIVLTLPSAPFPHPERAAGHGYQGKHFPADAHYRDSTVVVFIPRGVRADPTVDCVVHFHGWYNHVAKALREFKLVEQFAASRRNAILIAPEGPRDAPDSFGGKLEDPDGFKRLMADVRAELRRRPEFAQVDWGGIVLSGHSGGYHVISNILAQGGMPEHIREVWLFDALYGQTEKFAAWRAQHRGRIVNIFTERGGTKTETEKLMAALRGRGEQLIATTDTAITAEQMRTPTWIFLATDLGHNDVLAKRGTFRQFLETSFLAERLVPH